MMSSQDAGSTPAGSTTFMLKKSKTFLSVLHFCCGSVFLMLYCIVVYKMDLGMKPEAFENMLAETAAKIKEAQ